MENTKPMRKITETAAINTARSTTITKRNVITPNANTFTGNISFSQVQTLTTI